MQKRAESGPMAFGDDWTGIFVRGDEAVSLGMVLHSFIKAMENKQEPCPLDVAILRALAKRLGGCDERLQPEDVQRLLPFEECLLTRATVISPPPV